MVPAPPGTMRLRMMIALLTMVALGAACEKPEEKKGGEETATTEETKTQEVKEEEPKAKELTVYCGRNEEMLKPLMEKFQKDKGVTLKVQYAKSAQLAATLMEEGDASPADIFFAQDVSTLGFLQKEGKLVKLSDDLLNKVPETYRSKDGKWVGISGRARVFTYNTKLKPEELPKDVDALLDARWKGKLGWAPENASFQSFVAAMIAERGEEKTLEWVKGIAALEPKAYPKNTPLVTAVGRGEIDGGLTNHYYLFRLKAENGDDFAAANHYFKNGKAESLVNAAGVGVLEKSKNKKVAEELIAFLLSEESQKYFAEKTHEFPMLDGMAPADKLPKISELAPPATDLSTLGDLAGAVKVLREAGVIK